MMTTTQKVNTLNLNTGKILLKFLTALGLMFGVIWLYKNLTKNQLQTQVLQFIKSLRTKINTAYDNFRGSNTSANIGGQLLNNNEQLDNEEEEKEKYDSIVDKFVTPNDEMERRGISWPLDEETKAKVDALDITKLTIFKDENILGDQTISHRNNTAANVGIIRSLRNNNKISLLSGGNIQDNQTNDTINAANTAGNDAPISSSSNESNNLTTPSKESISKEGLKPR